MNRRFDEALLLYLRHCDAHRYFVTHPRSELSEILDGDWHLRNENGLIAIVTLDGEVEHVHDAAGSVHSHC